MDSFQPHDFTGEAGTIHTPGTVLASARVRQGLSVGDIAAKLRMGINQVEALESGDYGRLPTGTFLRGFVRSYAKVLGIDPQSVIDLLEQTHNPSEKPPIFVPSQNIKFTSPGEQFSTPRARAGLIVVLVMVISGFGWYWWAFIRPQQLAENKPQPVKMVDAEKKLESGAVSHPVRNSLTDFAAQQEFSPNEELNAGVVPTTIQDIGADPKGKIDHAVTAKPEGVQAKRALPGSTVLSFTFAGESWVEVVDGNGRTLISRRFKAGEVDEAAGKGPISVIIGNAPATHMTYNGANFDLSPHTRVAVARFTLK